MQTGQIDLKQSHRRRQQGLISVTNKPNAYLTTQMAPKWVKQVIKEQPIEPFSRQAFIMEDVTQRTAVFIYRVGPDESYQSQKKKKRKKTNIICYRFTSSAKPLFLPSSCHFFPQTTQINRNFRSHPVNFTTCRTPSATMSMFLFECHLS